MKNIKPISKFSLGLFSGILATSILFSTFAIAGSPIKLIINSKEITCDSPPQIINGRVLVPVRAVVENLGVQVVWDAQNNAVRIDSAKVQETKPSQPTNTNAPVVVTPQKDNVKPVVEASKPTNENNVQRTTWNGMDAIIKDGQTYFSVVEYNNIIGKGEANPLNYVTYNQNTKESTIILNSQSTVIPFNDENVQIYNHKTYFNSKFYR